MKETEAEPVKRRTVAILSGLVVGCLLYAHQNHHWEKPIIASSQKNMSNTMNSNTAALDDALASAQIKLNAANDSYIWFSGAAAVFGAASVLFAILAVFSSSRIVQYSQTVGVAQDNISQAYKNANRLEVAEVNERAANAIKRAGELGVSLSNLNSFVSAEQAKADASVKALEQSQAALNTAIQSANERLAPRTLTETQLVSISHAVSMFKGRLYSGMIAPGGGDTISLWGQIDKALQQAGWIRVPTPKFLGIADDTATLAYNPDNNVRVLAPFTVEGQPESGASAEIDAAAVSLVNALRSSGIATDFFRNITKPDLGPMGTGPQGIVIKVGPKMQ